MAIPFVNNIRRRLQIDRSEGEVTMNPSKWLSRCLAASASILALSAGYAGAAGAQTPAEPEASNAPGDVITVTARRVEESILEVPLSVSSLSDEDVSRLVLDGFDDYMRQIPSAIIVSGGPEYLTDISIRGQGGGRLGFSESTTGIYRNGMYIAGGGFGGRSLSRLDLFDMQRIEVLRGPQGALYGRNAVGGAVNVINRRPEFEFGGRGVVQHTFEIDRTDVEAVVNVPLIDETLSLRVGGFHNDQTGGFHTNIRTGNTVDQNRYSGVRGSLRWVASDALDVTATVERYDARNPGFGNLGYRATRFNGTPLDPDPYTRNMSDEAYVEIEQTNAFVTADGTASFGTWRATLSHSVRDGSRQDEDLDHFLGFQDVFFGPTEVVLFASQVEDFSRTGGDIYFSSDASGRMTWLVGAEFQTFDRSVATENYGQPAAPAGLRQQMRIDTNVEELNSLAAFAAFGFDATERLNLGLEMRIQRDEKDFTFDRVRNQPNSLAQELSVVDSRSWTTFMPVLTANYRVDEVNSVFGRIATGYRPGGFNDGVPDDVPNAQNLIAYDPEYATSAEAGWRRASSRFSFGLSAYYTHTRDTQLVTNASDTLFIVILQNIPSTRAWGLELEASGSWDVGPGDLTVSAGATTTDGEFGDGAVVLTNGVSTDLSGGRLNRARDLNAQLSAAYTFALTPNADLFLSGSMQHERGGLEDAAGTRSLPDFTLYDARIGVQTGNFTLSAFGRNLTDERYLIQTVNQNGYWTQGRVWGLRLAAEF